jgi:hypothetical protein
MVTVGTRKVSAVRVVPAKSVSEPSVLTKISKLPCFRMGDGIAIVGSRSFEIDSETSPYL